MLRYNIKPINHNQTAASTQHQHVDVGVGGVAVPEQQLNSPIKFVDNKFIFTDDQLFSINDIVNYFSTSTGANKELIKSKVGINDQQSITLLSPTESTFMGNVDMLVILNNGLYTQPQQTQQTNSLKKFKYLLLNHTLNIISSESDSTTISDERKQKLSKYSVGIVYQLTQYIHADMKTLTEENEKLAGLMANNNKLKELLLSKINI